MNIHNEVEKTATLKKEGIYFAFPFTLKQPRVKYQSATAWVDPENEMLPGANRQWFTTQGGVWGKGSDTNIGWATVDAPLITLEDINRGLWPESIQIRNGIGVFLCDEQLLVHRYASPAGRTVHLPLCADQRARCVRS